MNWLLIAVLVVIALGMINGYLKGFIRLMVSFLSIIITIVAVQTASPYVGRFLIDHTPIYHTISEHCIDVFHKDAGSYDANKKTDQVRAIETSRLPKSMKKDLMNNNNEDIYGLLRVTGFDEYIGAYVARTVINILAVVITFLAVFLLLKALVIMLDLVSRLPLINGVNRLAGVALGFVEGLIFVWVVFLIATLFINGSLGEKFFGLINDSWILSFIYTSNIFLKFVKGLIL